MTLYLWVSKVIDEEIKTVWRKSMSQFWMYHFDYRTDTVHSGTSTAPLKLPK